jgi:hypothetical protein
MLPAGKQRVHLGLEITREIIVYVQYETNKEDTAVSRASPVCFLSEE